MKTIKTFIFSAGLFLGLAMVVLLAACGGGGSSVTSDSGGTGQVAVLLTDFPNEYEEIILWVTEVTLIPADKNKAAVRIYYDPNGHGINLLDYQDEDFLLTVKKNVPAGYYSKIRMRVKDVRATGDGPCAEDNDGIEIKLPSGKVDLNPRNGGFYVQKGTTVAITLDIDCDKSINLHEAGNAGKCIFRPVVFVDIHTLQRPLGCPNVLKGTIQELIFDELNNIDGFILDMSQNHRGTLTVSLKENTLVYGPSGILDDAALEIGVEVAVIGRLLPQGELEALYVTVGEVQVERGVVGADFEDGKFSLQQPGDTDLDVNVTAETTVLVGCRDDDVVDPGKIAEEIKAGKRARVVGVDAPSDGFVATVIFLKQEIRGVLNDIIEVIEGNEVIGSNLVIEYAPGQETIVYLEKGAPVYLEGDGEVPFDLLTQWVKCRPGEIKVRVIFPPPNAGPNAIPEVYVKPDRLYGRVTGIDPYNRRILRVDGSYDAVVRYGAFIVADVGAEDLPVSVYSISKFDTITAFGLETCPFEDMDFQAFMVFIE